MDTLGFLQAVLPDTGPYCLVVFKAGNKAPAHKSASTLDELAQYAAKYDKPGLSVFHCCSAGTPTSGKRPNEDSDDWHAKSLWIDLDCGPSKDYPDQRSAVRALQAFCKHFNLPIPLIVNSGYGIHAYWVFDAAIGLGEWVPMAVAIREAAATFGLKLDARVTTDVARILRPVGTHNRKDDANPKLVKLFYDAPRTTPTRIREALSEFIGVTTQYGGASDAGLNDDLTAHAYVNLPSSIHAVADKCKQVAAVRDTKGVVGYDHWRGVIGLCSHSVEGAEVAHDWSKGHSEYDPKETQQKYDTWNAAPTRCSFLESANPGGCDGCPHKGNITSPIQLGRLEPAENKAQTVDAIVEGATVQAEVPAICKGYIWDDDKKLLARIMPDKNDVYQAYPFSKTLFYITHRVRYDDGSFGIGIRSHLSDGRIRDFGIDTGLLATPTKLAEELGHKGELLPTNIRDASLHMTAYLRDDLEHKKKLARELNTYTSFGWKDERQSFLVGDRLYKQDGTTSKVLVGGYAINCVDQFPQPVGTVEGYATALNSIYNAEGMEPMQYAICVGFGSLLTPFGENNYRGLLCALSSGTSGKGKTSVCLATLFAFGNAEKMIQRSGDTKNGRYATLGTYSSIPLLFDEFSNWEPKNLSDLAYDIASGAERKRLVSTGGAVKMAAQMEWWMSPYMTGNDDFHGKLAQHNPNSQAEGVRLVQIKIDEYDIPKYALGVVDTAISHMRMNMGTAGEAFIKYVVQNRNKVAAMVQDTLAKVSVLIDGEKYRFYRNNAACSLTALQIMRELGIAAFDYDKVFAFAIRLMRKLCNEVAEYNTVTPEDAVGMMINEFMPRIMISREYRDSRDSRGKEFDVTIQRGQTLVGRLVAGAANTKKDEYTGKLYLVKKDVKDWCLKHRLDYNSMLAYAKSKGYLVSDGERFNLTRGTDFPTVQVTCIALDHYAIEGAIPKLVLHTNPQAVDTSKPNQL